MPSPHAPPPGDPAEGRPPGEPAGLKDGLRDLLRSVLEHARLRWVLFEIEAAEAAGQLGRVAVALGVVLAGGGLAYVLAWAAVVAWVARRWNGGDVALPLAGAAGVHALAASLSVWWLVSRSRSRPLFPATRAEFAEDRKWLNRPHP